MQPGDQTKLERAITRAFVSALLFTTIWLAIANIPFMTLMLLDGYKWPLSLEAGLAAALLFCCWLVKVGDKE